MCNEFCVRELTLSILLRHSLALGHVKEAASSFGFRKRGPKPNIYQLDNNRTRRLSYVTALSLSLPLTL